MAIFGIRNKWAFLLLPLAVILDFGTVFGMRRGLHSIFIVFGILAIIYALCRIKKIKETRMIIGISAFYLISHLFLDIGGPMSLFWPFITDAYKLTIQIVMQGIIPSLVITTETIAIESLEQSHGYLVSEAGFGLLFAFVIMFAAKKLGMIKNGG